MTIQRMILIMSAAIFSLNAAEWKECNSNGGYANSLISYNGVLYAGCSYSLYDQSYLGATGYGFLVSNDRGLTWQTQNAGLPAPNYLNGDLESIVGCGNFIFGYLPDPSSAICRSCPICRFNIQTSSWEALNTAFSVEDLYSDGSNVYAMGYDSIRRSTDYGTTWAAICKSFPSQYDYVSAMYSTGSRLFVGASGIFFSTNNGSSWTQADTSAIFGRQFTSFTTNGPYIFAGATTGIFRSSNDGGTWVPVKVGVSVSSLVVKGGRILASTNSGVMSSSDSGNNWESSSFRFFNNAHVSGQAQSLTILDNVLFAHIGYFFPYGTGELCSFNEVKKKWVLMNSSFGGSVSAICSLGKYLIVGAREGVFRSIDTGVTWTMQCDSIGTFPVASFLELDTSLFAVGDAGIYRSVDSGATWLPCTTGLPANKWILSLSNIGSTLLAGTYQNGVYKSIDNGDSWVPASVGLPANAGVGASFVYGKKVIATADPGGFFVSTDSALTWNASPEYSGMWAYSFASNGSHLFAASTGVLSSADSGITWVYPDADSSALLSQYVSTVAACGQSVYAGLDESSIGGENGLYISNTNGRSWYKDTTGLTTTPILSLYYDGTTLFAGTNGKGLWRKTLPSQIAAIEGNRLQTAKRRYLELSVTSVSNSMLKLEFVLSRPQHVSITVLNLMGKKIATIGNSSMKAGVNQLYWSAAGISDGLYIVKLHAEGFTRCQTVNIR